jgi:hypothetical protein
LISFANATFSNISAIIMATSFSGGRNRSTRRDPPNMGKQLVSFITCGCELSAPFLYLQSRARIGFHGQYLSFHTVMYYGVYYGFTLLWSRFIPSFNFFLLQMCLYQARKVSCHVRGIDLVSFYDFAIRFWNCSDRVLSFSCFSFFFYLNQCVIKYM